MTERSVLAVDVGGTVLKAAVLDHTGGVLWSGSRPAGAADGPDAVLANIVDLGRAALECAGPVVAAGLAMPGIVDPDRGLNLFSSNLGFRNTPIRDHVSDALGVPVSLAHDVYAAGLAEATLGAGRGVDDFLLLCIGTGIAGAPVVAGAPVRGGLGQAGEIGHISVYPDGEPCPCGGRGCVETTSSASSVGRRYGALGGAPRPDGSPADAADVASRLGSDPLADQVWAECVEGLARALLIYVTVMAPSLVIVGGGFADAGDALFAPLRLALKERATFQTIPPIVGAALGNRAGVLGAGVLAWSAVEP